MIVRNEEKNIASCLNSIKNIVDEIIIVDTGSTDRTKEVVNDICKNFDAKRVKIFDFKWVNDFSAARNESIEHAAKDWILILDADEIIDEIGLKTIKELISNNDVDGFLFLQKNYTNNTLIAGFNAELHIKDNLKYTGWYGTLITRLFRNNKGFKFSGTVHELVETSIEEKGGVIISTNVVIHHYGNIDPVLVSKKRQFYLELCKNKINQNPDSTSFYELGILYKENGNIDDALKSFKKSLELNQRNEMPIYELGVIYQHQKKYDEAIKNYEECIKINESSEAFQNLGVCYLKKGLFKEGYTNLFKAMLLNPNKFTIYNSLGAVLEKIGNYETAKQMLEIGIKLNPINTIGFYNLGIVLDKMGDYENAIINYEKAIELGHRKKEDINKRVEELKSILINHPKFHYSFKVGS